MKFQEYIKRLPVFALMGMLLCTTGIFLSSCDDDDESSKEVALFSFGPAGVQHGEQIKFIGQNLDKITSVVLSPGIEISSSEFVTRSSTLIEVVIPQAAEAGKVVLKTPSGDIETKTPLSFEVPVVISSITAEARPGANITISGTLVNWIEEVKFTNDLAVTEFVSKSVNELVVTVPMEAETGFLVFKSGGTEPLTFASEGELKVTLPAVTTFTPAVKHTENLTITGTDLDLVTSVIFYGNYTVEKAQFVSQSATEIVVAVPVGVTKGKFTLTQLSPVEVVTANELTITLPVGTNVAPKPAKPGIDDITITGTNLDLVAELTFPSVSAPVDKTAFKSHSATEIVLTVPAGAKSGGISYKTIHGYSSALGTNLVIPAPGPPPLAITMYDETMAPGGGNWSWNSVVSDPASTEQFYSGDKSWKFSTTSGGGASSGGMTPIDATGQGVFVFSLYGGPGTDGAQVAAILGDDSGDEWGSYNTVTLEEGQWTEYRLPLTNYPTVNFAAVRRWIFKVEGITTSTIYVDRVGFDPAGPPPLDITMFDETIAFGGGSWSWGGTAVTNSTEQAYSGTISFKHTTSGTDGGASVGGMTGVDASGMAVLKFSLYGGPGTNGKNVACILGSDGADKWDSYNTVVLVEGAWTEYQIPLTSYPTVNLSNVTRWIFKVENATNAVIYVDRVGFND